MRYGSLEYAYAVPFAEALVTNASFRSWVLARTPFANYGREARLRNEAMHALRGKSAENWWRSHFTEKCRCNGCSGQETDLLAIFEASDFRFAVHFQVKQPTDMFPAAKDQAANYSTRAQCWVTSPPKAVLPHQAASTALLCSATKLVEYAPHLAKFDTVLTFEEIAKVFPEATAPAMIGTSVPF